MKILVAMSGGVDSSVVAHLLAAEGHELIGVRFSLWSDPLAPPLAQVLPSKCCNPQTVYRANAVAEALGIPLHLVNLEEDFKRDVVDPFLRDYARGITPNPCISCNRTIKFGRLLRLAQQEGCEAIATGHYARIAQRIADDGTPCFALLQAADARKDQSYFLYGLAQEQLREIRFPLGAMRKEEVFALAREFGVPLPEEYQESQDVCFYPEKDPQEFLKRHIPQAIHPGPICTRGGKQLGVHKGLPLYTVGQRRGLAIGGLKVPLHVVEKDVQTNTIFVAPYGAEQKLSVRAVSARWLAGAPPESGCSLHARLHSQGAKHPGTFTLQEHTPEGFVFHFRSPVPHAAPGQSIVLHRGDEVIGGGVMEGE